jgi:hypothetical protein
MVDVPLPVVAAQWLPRATSHDPRLPLQWQCGSRVAVAVAVAVGVGGCGVGVGVGVVCCVLWCVVSVSSAVRCGPGPWP